MKKGKGSTSEIKGFPKEVSSKMDSSMRRLLLLSEDEIRKQYRADLRRITKRSKEIREIDPRLRSIATDTQRKTFIRHRRSLMAELLPKRDLFAIFPDILKPLKIRAIVNFTGNRSDLENMGIEVHSQAQDIFTITGTQKQLSELVSKASCRRLRSPRMLFPEVEDACGQAEITEIHDPRPANPNGFQGNGILIGIIDSCLDVTHHGFRDPTTPGAHDSRVLYYWAQTTHTQDAWGNPVQQPNPPGDTPQQFTNGATPGDLRPNFAGLNYGRVYTRNFINTALGLANTYGTNNNQICCEPISTEEHGTHCAGIAAGSGHVNNWATAPVHIGAAPQADIVHVRIRWNWNLLNSGATFEDAILDGINFCLEAAQFHGMPIVISVSQGTSWGPHNGSSDFDLARDNLINSFNNRSIVWSAGNDDNDIGFRTGTIASGNTIENFDLTATKTDSLGNPVIYDVWLDIWYNGPELDYRISHGGGNSGWQDDTVNQYNGNIGGRDIEAERDIELGGGLRGIRIYVDNAQTNEIFTIELRNPDASLDVEYHAWVGNQGWIADLTGSTQGENTLSDTGCGKSILTVGACNKVNPPNTATGEEVTSYSGAGPTLDGRIKPEIVAVGGTPNDPATPLVNEYDGIESTASDQASGYTAKIGTSMSSPLVAGAIACLLEEYSSPAPVGLNLELNQDTVKALLIEYANTLNLNLNPEVAGYVPWERNKYGHGRLRMIGPVDHLLPPVDIDLWIRTANDDYGEEPYPGGCFCGAPDIRVFDAGTNNETTNITWGTTYDVRVTVRNLGDTQANNATLRLKYTLPHTAPDTWFEAEDAGNNKLVNTNVTVPAMNQVEIQFSWRPQSAEIGAQAGATHFCLLAEVDHVSDPLNYPAPTASGGSAWSTNIKSTNNVALRNLHIQ